MMSVLQALLLGVLQGVTEWLPVSSSGHLVLLQTFLGINAPLLFDVVLHLGTVFAVFAVYYQDVFKMLEAFLRWDFKCEHGRLLLFLALGSIPTAIIGFVFHDVFKRMFSNTMTVGLALIATGVILYFTRGKQGSRELNTKYSLLVGVAQGVAIVPGLSRSGATISTGLFLGLDRKKAAQYSMLLSVPAIIGASALEYSMGGVVEASIAPLFAGFVSALAVGYVSIRLLLRLLSQDSFHSFAYYCWFVGGLVVASQLF